MPVIWGEFTCDGVLETGLDESLLEPGRGVGSANLASGTAAALLSGCGPFAVPNGSR